MNNNEALSTSATVRIPNEQFDLLKKHIFLTCIILCPKRHNIIFPKSSQAARPLATPVSFDLQFLSKVLQKELKIINKNNEKRTNELLNYQFFHSFVVSTWQNSCLFERFCPKQLFAFPAPNSSILDNNWS